MVGGLAKSYNLRGELSLAFRDCFWQAGAGASHSPLFPPTLGRPLLDGDWGLSRIDGRRKQVVAKLKPRPLSDPADITMTQCRSTSKYSYLALGTRQAQLVATYKIMQPTGRRRLSWAKTSFEVHRSHLRRRRYSGKPSSESRGKLWDDKTRNSKVGIAAK